MDSETLVIHCNCGRSFMAIVKRKRKLQCACGNITVIIRKENQPTNVWIQPRLLLQKTEAG